MDRKGFTLIELLAVIILIGLLGVLIVPNMLSSVEESKEVSYKILVKNVVTGAQMYYEECEYGDLSNAKYGEYACKISSDYIDTTLGALANTGFLKVTDTRTEEGSNKKIKVVLNPKDNRDISACPIKISKIRTTSTDENGIENVKISYKVESLGGECPTTLEYGSEE